MSHDARRAAVFLDRDGVINPMWYDAEHGTVDSPCGPDQFSLGSGVAQAIRRIHDLGLLAVVVSNQPIVAKGKATRELLDAITSKMEDELAQAGTRLDGIWYCLHHPDALLPEYRAICDCRKPLPGLLVKAADALGIDRARSYMLGDGVVDIQAGVAAGTRTIWIGNWRCDVCSVFHDKGAQPDAVAPDLGAAIEVIANERAVSAAAGCTGKQCAVAKISSPKIE